MSEPKTLRDEFAMAALTGMLANPDLNAPPEGYAKDAYLYADAMLKQRTPAPRKEQPWVNIQNTTN